MNDLMRFVSEEDLRNQFWKMYGYRQNILRFQFECPLRSTNGADLITVEQVNNSVGKGWHIEFVSFEFKLDDIRKALSQAYDNSTYCHKNYIVMPDYKKKVLEDKYISPLESYPSIGIILQSFQGKWEIFKKARFKPDDQLKYHQEIMKMLLNHIG